MNSRRLAPLAIPALLALVAPVAAAQTPTTPAPPAPPPPAPAPPPAAGSAAFKVVGGLATKQARYVAPFQTVRLTGRAKPFVAGQKLRLEVVRKGKVSKVVTGSVRAGGRFAFRVRVGNPGGLRFVVKHDATPQQVAFRARDQRLEVVDWSADVGTRGTKVLLLQRALAKLHFAVPLTGYYDDGTARAVLAFRKTNEMGRVGAASTSVYAWLLRGKGAYKLHYPKAGKHVEFDWSRQVVVLADKGRPHRIYHTSSGAPVTPTVFGTYRFYMKTPGTNAKGMVDSAYFIRGYAIHGYVSVPTYPASHGCLRVPIPNARQIFDWIDLGDQIFLYR
jgi:peptidoglycan hydrolase-like protein with peptidoglycan-binding domain